MSEDEVSLPPEQMLALLEAQQRKVDRELLGPIPWLFGIWGVAWLVGFLCLWSAWDGGNPWFRIPGTVAAVVFGALMVAAIVTSAIIGARINRGVRGESNFTGAVYGISWTLSGAAFAAVGMGLIANGMSHELTSIYFPSAYSLMVGILYLAGTALWREMSQLVLGIILLVIGSIAPFFGAPANNLVMALAGGGAFLLTSLVMAVRLSRSR
jgi:hypothetical protein